jgi:hypothetical protein
MCSNEIFKDLEESIVQRISDLRCQLEEIDHLREKLNELPDSWFVVAYEMSLKNDWFRGGEDAPDKLADVPQYEICSAIVEEWENKVKSSLRSNSSLWDDKPQLKKSLKKADRLLKNLNVDEAVSLLKDLKADSAEI